MCRSIIEQVINKSRYPSRAWHLSRLLWRRHSLMDKDALQRTCQRFRTRIKVVIEAKEGYRVILF